MTERLRRTVQHFNEGLAAWAKETGCVANFCWRYDNRTGRKFLELTEIDFMVFRASPPTDSDVRAALDKVRT